MNVKTKAQLMNELKELRQRITDLENRKPSATLLRGHNYERF